MSSAASSFRHRKVIEEERDLLLRVVAICGGVGDAEADELIIERQQVDLREHVLHVPRESFRERVRGPKALELALALSQGPWTLRHQPGLGPQARDVALHAQELLADAAPLSRIHVRQ